MTVRSLTRLRPVDYPAYQSEATLACFQCQPTSKEASYHAPSSPTTASSSTYPIPSQNYSPTTRSSPPSHSPSTTRPRTPPPTSSQKSPNAARSRSSPRTFYSTPPSPSSKHHTRPQGISRWPITRSQCPGGTCRRLLMSAWRKRSMEAPQGSSLLAALRFKGSCLSKVKASWIKFAPLYRFICSCGSRFCSLWWCLLCSGCSQVSSTMPSAIRAKLRFSDVKFAILSFYP